MNKTMPHSEKQHKILETIFINQQQQDPLFINTLWSIITCRRRSLYCLQSMAKHGRLNLHVRRIRGQLKRRELENRTETS